MEKYQEVKYNLINRTKGKAARTGGSRQGTEWGSPKLKCRLRTA